MLNEFARTELLLGRAAMEKLQRARVAVFGLGGVGSYAAEALVRAGIGALDVVDDDRICLTNINRQLLATHKTVGKNKTDVLTDRIHDINPACNVLPHGCFYNEETAACFDFSEYDYIVDAIDTVSSKLTLIERAKAAGTPVISCMGVGNKLNPTDLTVADIYETSYCPLSRVMRYELRKRGITSLKVVYSKEPAITPMETEALSCKFHCVCPPGTQRKCAIRRQVPGSVSFVPPVAGFILASEVVKDLVGLSASR